LRLGYKKPLDRAVMIVNCQLQSSEIRILLQTSLQPTTKWNPRSRLRLSHGRAFGPRHRIRLTRPPPFRMACPLSRWPISALTEAMRPTLRAELSTSRSVSASRGAADNSNHCSCRATYSGAGRRQLGTWYALLFGLEPSSTYQSTT
jgi:hypothetical protein